MPRICEFHGIVIRMFHREHGPPYFHASCGEHEALIAITPIEVVSGRFPTRARRLVFEWASLHQEELAENWNRGERKVALVQIDPLP